MKSKILAIILALAMAGTLVACGSEESSESTESASASESETPTESESAEPTETEGEEDELAPDGVWETDGERVTIEDDTVTIDYIDDEGEVTETYWVGSFELDEDSDTWTSTRDPDAEMTCESDTIEFTWSGEGENVYDKLSYAVTNEDGTKTTITLDRVESLGDVEKGVVPDFDSNDGDTSSTSASASASNNKNSDTASVDTSASASTSNNSNNDSNSDNSGGTTSSGSNSGTTNTTTNNSNTNSGNSGSTNTSTGNSSSSNSSNSSSGSSSGSSSSGSSSSGTTTTACSHNYVGTVTKNATCSATGVKTYTCSKCGASYTETIPATGNHNYQPVYTTVHHDEVGHYETTPVYGTRYVCGTCGWYQIDTAGMSETEQRQYLQWEHSYMVHGYPGSYSTQDVQVGTTSTWVVDSAAYDEQVISYYKCSVCGATK